MYKIFLIIAFAFTSLYGQKYALVNGDVYTVTNGILKETSVLINGNRIESVGTNINVTDDYEILDCSGMRIYPGLFDSGSKLGLQEIGSLPETRDFAEVGEFNPEVKALTAVNPNSELIAIARVNGITTVHAVPTGGLFSGQSAIINLDGFTTEEIKVISPAGLHLNFPEKGMPSIFSKEKLEEAEKKYNEEIKKLNSIWKLAENYYRNSKDDSLFQIDLRFEPFISVFKKSLPLIITVNNDYDILKAIEWVKEKEIKVIFSGVAEGWRVADKIADSKIPCLAGPILTLPSRGESKYDVTFNNLNVLNKAGVKCAFRTNETENVRNVPYELAAAISFGMSENEALKMITINPAEIFGIEKDYGSIEAGKIANLIVIKGNIFDVKNNPSHVFIKGKNIPLVSRHTILYEQFKNRK